MPRNSSATKRKLTGDPTVDPITGGTSRRVTLMVTRGAREGLRESARCFMPFLKKLSNLIGIYTLLVGLYANFYIFSQLAAG